MRKPGALLAALQTGSISHTYTILVQTHTMTTVKESAEKKSLTIIKVEFNKKFIVNFNQIIFFA